MFRVRGLCVFFLGWLGALRRHIRDLSAVNLESFAPNPINPINIRIKQCRFFYFFFMKYRTKLNTEPCKHKTEPQALSQALLASAAKERWGTCCTDGRVALGHALSCVWARCVGVGVENALRL